MKRIERLGSVAFITILITLVFHLIAISSNNWREITCHGCDDDDIFGSWSTGLVTRCYQVSTTKIFNPIKDITGSLTGGSFRSSVCVTNKMLMVNKLQNASSCLQLNRDDGDVVCAIGDYYTNNNCKCDYLSRTKLVLASSIITSLALGALIFLSHLTAFVKIENILKWLIPFCYGLLCVTVVFIMITLIAAGSELDEDVNELRFSATIIKVIHYNETSFFQKYFDEEKTRVNVGQTYTTKLGVSFGMELLAFHFSLISLVLYLLMFLVKKRPNAIKAIM